MYRKFATAAAILTAAFVVGAPAFALLAGPGDGPHLEPGGDAHGGGGATTTTITTGPSDAPPSSPWTSDPPPELGATEPSVPSDGPVGGGSTSTEPPSSSTGGEEHRDVPRLRLACAAGVAEGMAGARCEWSPSDSPDFARYVLWRQDPGHAERRVVFQSTDRSVTAYGDKPLAPGEYHYGLLALATDNRTVGIAEPVAVTVTAPPSPSSPPTTQPAPVMMSFGCHTVAGPMVECRWTPVTSERFAAYRLYREVPGTPAGVWFTTSDRTVTSAIDDGVEPGATYSYRIVAVDGDGRVIGSGGPFTVTIPAGSGDAPTT